MAKASGSGERERAGALEDAIRIAELEASDAAVAHRVAASRVGAVAPSASAAHGASSGKPAGVDVLEVDVSPTDSPTETSSTSSFPAPPPSAAPPRRRRCRLPTPQHAVERAVSRAFGRVGLFVGRRPVTSMVGSVLVALALSSGLAKVKFEARSHKLYIPQNDFMADDRRYIEATFGDTPEPGILIVGRKDGAPISNQATMLAMLDLHERVASLTVEHAGANVSYADVCYRRFVGMLGRYECVVSSPLELWWYQREQLLADTEVGSTMRDALETHNQDFGTEDGRIMALQLKYFFEPRAPVDTDGRYGAYRAWEAAMRENILGARAEGSGSGEADGVVVHVPAGGYDASTSPLAVAYWSTNFNEEEAQSFVQDDSYLMALSLVFITVYVCITLGGVTADCRQTRLLLGSTCALCTGLAMSSGFGLASMLGVPLQPISPIVCFTLLGVAVDDMIIIVMAFEATDPARDVAERLSRALSRAGSTITVTSVTSTVAFLTGYFVDFPALAYFCVPASLCIVMVYFLQMTFFAACLTLDARRAAAGRLDCCPCAVLTDDQVYRVPRMLGREPSSESKAPRVRPLQVCVNKHWARVLLSNPVRVLVLVGFLSLAGVSAYLMKHLAVGLPARLSLPDGSPILDFIDGLDEFWQGTQMQEVELVLQNVDLGDGGTLKAINRTVGALEELPFVLRFAPRWDQEYLKWRNCTWAEVMRTADLGAGINMDAWLADDKEHSCGADAQRDGAAEGEDGEDEDGDDPTCVDDDESFKRVSSGRPCSVAVTHCKRPAAGWRIVSSRCPKTCGLCPKRGAAGADGEGGADGGSAQEKGMASAAAAPHRSRASARRRHRAAARSDAPPIDIGPSSGAAAAAAAAGASRGADGVAEAGAGALVAEPAAEPGALVAEPRGARRRRLQFGPGIVQGGRQFEGDVVSGGGQVAAEARFFFYVRMSNDNAVAWQEYRTMVRVLEREAKALPGAIVYHFKYEFAYCDLMMPLFGLKNLLMAAATIFGVVCLFLPASIAFVSTFTVMCIDVILLGLITVMGMSLNTITLVTLLLALALAIDYSCHIGHAYVVAPGRTRKEKVAAAIETIGFSIINAAGSTLLGTLFLAASQSPVFRIFFVLVWSTIFLGLISGMAFVPVVLSFIGPIDPDDDPDGGLHDLQLDASMKGAKGAARRARQSEARARAHAADGADEDSEHFYTPTATRAEAHRLSVKWATDEVHVAESGARRAPVPHAQRLL